MSSCDITCDLYFRLFYEIFDNLGLVKMSISRKERILVIKHGALVDLVQGFDAFAALRAGRPQAHIALLTSPIFADLTRLMPWFDEILVDTRSSPLNLIAAYRVRAILRDDWQFIVDMQCSRRTARYHRHFAPKASRWFGTAKGASDPFPDFTGVNNNRRMLTAAKMAGGIEVASDDVDFSWLTPAGRSVIAGLDPAVRGGAVLIPGCSPAKPEKKWPVERFAALAAQLHESGEQVVVVGTNSDRATTDALLAQAPFCRDLVGKTDLVGLAAVLRSASLVVGNDTGPLFLAARLGAPSLMVMGPETNPDMSAPTGARCCWLAADPIREVTDAAVFSAVRAVQAG